MVVSALSLSLAIQPIKKSLFFLRNPLEAVIYQVLQALIPAGAAVRQPSQLKYSEKDGTVLSPMSYQGASFGQGRLHQSW
jgi:hypothetical protein